MSKVIRTTIDSQGNVHSDLSGFAGQECVVEEERFRFMLAELGLVIQTATRTEKAHQESVKLSTRPQVGQ